MPEQLGIDANHLIQVLVTVGLALLIGWEREVRSTSDEVYKFGGVRTFPIIGLIGYGVGVIAPGNAICTGLGLLAVSGLLVVAYVHKLRDGPHGATTEVAAIAVYVVGALVAHEFLWLACAMSVAILLLLQAKAPLESFTTQIPRQEIATLVQFMLLAGVILPVLPNEGFTRFQINPFKTWLIVVAVSGISYASYVVRRLLRSRSTELLTAVLGGTYSSTATTIVLAKRSRLLDDPRLYAGAMTLTSSVMYLRIAILLWLFNAGLGWMLGPRLVILSLVGATAGYLIASAGRPPRTASAEPEDEAYRNPLEIWSALLFAGLFVAITIATRLAGQYLGDTGLYALAAVMGISDVDPFILSLTQTAGATAGTPLHVAAVAILVASASNNVLKGIYAITFGERRTGVITLVSIVLLGALSFLSLIGL